MTYLDKLKELLENGNFKHDKEDTLGEIAEWGSPNTCPSYFELKDSENCLGDASLTCKSCWNREIPGTENDTDL